MVKGTIFGSLSDALHSFWTLGFDLVLIESGSYGKRSLNKDGNDVLKRGLARRDDSPMGWFAGPLCSDTNGELFNKTLEDLQASFTELKKQSYIGGSAMGTNEILCTQW